MDEVEDWNLKWGERKKFDFDLRVIVFRGALDFFEYTPCFFALLSHGSAILPTREAVVEAGYRYVCGQVL